MQEFSASFESHNYYSPAPRCGDPFVTPKFSPRPFGGPFSLDLVQSTLPQVVIKSHPSVRVTPLKTNVGKPYLPMNVEAIVFVIMVAPIVRPPSLITPHSLVSLNMRNYIAVSLFPLCTAAQTASLSESRDGVYSLAT